MLLVATDVGIASILPYVKHLVDASRRRQSIARKVEVIWQIDDYGMCVYSHCRVLLFLFHLFGSANKSVAYTLWLPDVMQELLDQDLETEGGFEACRGSLSAKCSVSV